jgi:hypothetical protein
MPINSPLPSAASARCSTDHLAPGLADSGLIILFVANQNEFAGVFPTVIHPRIDGETTISEYVEKIEGEVALDSYVKAQTSAPEVVKRITELESCLQRLANAVLASRDINRHPELRAVAEEAKLLLKNRLEVDDTKHRFHSELGVYEDDVRMVSNQPVRAEDAARAPEAVSSDTPNPDEPPSSS